MLSSFPGWRTGCTRFATLRVTSGIGFHQAPRFCPLRSQRPRLRSLGRGGLCAFCYSTKPESQIAPRMAERMHFSVRLKGSWTVQRDIRTPGRATVVLNQHKAECSVHHWDSWRGAVTGARSQNAPCQTRSHKDFFAALTVMQIDQWEIIPFDCSLHQRVLFSTLWNMMIFGGTKTYIFYLNSNG